ncbi:MAG: YibE/F family protein [Desulfobacterium sp.]|nr:YibE/F family protein [Desulfobacterium sp.]
MRLILRHQRYLPWVVLAAVLLAIHVVAAHLVTDKLLQDKVPLLYLTVVFLGGLIIIGGVKGLKAIFTLVFTIWAVIKVLLPMILKGYDPVLVSVGICGVVIVVTLLVISGVNKKTLAAIAGTLGGVIIAGFSALLIGYMANLTGLGNEESIHLILYSRNIDFRGLLFAGIIIGALGAVMDVGMSVASSMYEIQSANPEIGQKALITAGMNVGRDIMGTMSNTLILAYVGSSLNLLLLFSTYDTPFNEIIGRDNMAAEVVRALAGSVGLIFTIPLTALAASRFAKNKP